MLSQGRRVATGLDCDIDVLTDHQIAGKMLQEWVPFRVRSAICKFFSDDRSRCWDFNLCADGRADEEANTVGCDRYCGGVHGRAS